MCKNSGSNSQKRRGHRHLKEFGVLCLNQPVVTPVELATYSIKLVEAHCVLRRRRLLIAVKSTMFGQPLGVGLGIGLVILVSNMLTHECRGDSVEHGSRASNASVSSS